MSHLKEQNIQQNCQASFHSRTWQYGQPFPSDAIFLFTTKKREFLVDPFDCLSHAIVVNAAGDKKQFRRKDDGRGTHVFVNSLTADRVDQWKSRINWGELAAKMNIGVDTDPLSVQMTGTENSGFKYRVNYDGKGSWSCTCKHFETHPEECCKHINASVDTILFEEHGSQYVDERHLGWRPYTTIYDFGQVQHEYPGYTDMVEEVTMRTSASTPATTSAQLHQFVAGPYYY
jgi:hypothetical protein